MMRIRRWWIWGGGFFLRRGYRRGSTVSCDSCHDLSTYGANGEAVLEKREAKELSRDVPGLFNIAGLIHYRWDGSLNTLDAQTAAALTDANEMGMADEAGVVERVRSIGEYGDRFGKAYPGVAEPVTFENIVRALVAFQRGLVTRAPIDRFLLGDDEALTEDQLKGAMVFDRLECGACHTGTGFGGQMLQKVGIVMPWPNQEDQGYFEVTGRADHKMVFKVPSLRNVEKTAPYFHDYSARSLRRAIKTMALYERGQDLGLDDILLLEEFLKSLTGELPVDYIKEPE